MSKILFNKVTIVALLILLLFVVLALVMLVTRRVDWYAVSEQVSQQARELRGQTFEAPTA